MDDNSTFRGNPNLPRSDRKIVWTQEQIAEYKKCMDDPVYFAETYFKIIDVDKGLVPLRLYQFQKDTINAYLVHRKILINASRQVGKCVTFDTLVRVRNKKTGEVKQIEIGDLIKAKLESIGFDRLEDGYEGMVTAFIIAFNRSTGKIIASCEIDDWEIMTDTGYQPISAIHVTKKYEVYALKADKYHLQCADDHVVFKADFSEVYVKDLSPGDTILTESGPVQVDEITPTGRFEHMVDVTVDSGDHRFYSNGILSHNTTIATVIILHYCLFRPSRRVALLANKASAANEILERIQLAFEYLPDFLKPGVRYWNKGSVVFDNKSKIIAAASSSSAIRGKSQSMVYCDETAWIPRWQEFSASVLPTLSSGKETITIFTSTPNGMNHFYEYTEGAKAGTNGFHYIEVPWHAIPGRDEKWKQEVLATINFDLDKFDVEYNCAFQGSSNTLISGSTLKVLSTKKQSPIHKSSGMNQYEQPIKDHIYVVTVDVSRGKGLDYSAFHVIDVSVQPMKQVFTFRDNTISPSDYATTVYNIANLYNDAYVLIEINDIGGQVADMLHEEFEYENIIYTETAGRAGARVSGGFGRSANRGIRTTKSVKSIGCSVLKLLIEQNKLEIVDEDTILEMNAFSKKGQSYEAEDGHTDDLVMGLVLFAWLSRDKFFLELTNVNTMNLFRERTEKELEDEMIPFGFKRDGITEFEERILDPNGDIWSSGNSVGMF